MKATPAALQQRATRLQAMSDALATKPAPAARAASARARRGLFRLWCVISLLWMLFGLVAFARQPTTTDLPFILLVTIGYPIGLLVGCAVAIKLAIWVWSGFRAGP